MATEKVLSLISEVRGGFIRFLERELAASSANEVQPSYGPVLSALFKHDGKLKMKEIAHAANRDKSTVTYLVNNLVKIGYVKKEPGRQDCRETYVVLTQKAWKVLICLSSVLAPMPSVSRRSISGSMRSCTNFVRSVNQMPMPTRTRMSTYDQSTLLIALIIPCKASK